MNAYAMSPEELPVKEAGLIGGAISGLAAFWYAYRRVRGNLREDGAAEKTASSYKAIIEQMETQITRLEVRIAASEKRAGDLEQRVYALSQRVTDELNARYLAESQLRRSEGERNALQAELAEMKSVGKSWDRGL